MTDRSAGIRWGVAAAVTGMVAWIVGVALIPLDAKLERGDRSLTATIAAHSGRLYTAALLAVAGAVLLVAFFAVLAVLVPADRRGGGPLRVALAAGVLTEALVATGGAFGLTAVHTAAGGGDPALVALAWRGMWLAPVAGAPPAIVFTVAAVLGLDAAGLSPRWVAVVGAACALSHVLALDTLAQQGAFAPDGLVATIVPVTTVVWVLCVAANLSREALAG
jgi:hypothetical protein